MALVLPSMQHGSQHMPPPTFRPPPAGLPGMGPAQPYAPQAPSFQNLAHQHLGQPGRAEEPRGRHQQQPQRQQKGLGLRTSRGKKRRRNKGRADGQPSLAALSAQNRRRAQQHFLGRHDTPGMTPASAPRTAPHAPHNDNSFILNQHGRLAAGDGRFDSPGMTPSATPSGNVQWTPAHSFPAADYSSLDKDAADLGAQLDFFGTNEGLVERSSSDDESSGGDGSADEGDEAHGWHLRTDESETAMQGLPAHVRARLASQASYIAQLEADNLDLQEKYSLLQHELEEAKATVRTMAAQTQETPASASAAIAPEAAASPIDNNG